MGGLNWSRKLRTEEHGVAGKSPGHEVEKGDFQRVAVCYPGTHSLIF